MMLMSMLPVPYQRRAASKSGLRSRHARLYGADVSRQPVVLDVS